LYKTVLYTFLLIFFFTFLTYSSNGGFVDKSLGFVASCDMRATTNQCYDFRGNGWSGKDDAKMVCEMHKGIYADSACPVNDDMIGSCSNTTKKRRNDKEIIFVFYKPALVEHAEMGCKDNFIPKK